MRLSLRLVRTILPLALRSYWPQSTLYGGDSLRRLSLTICIAILLCGCTSQSQRIRSMRASFHAGDLATAHDAIENSKSKKGEDEIFLLDRAMIELFSNDAQSAESLLQTVRDRFDEREQTALAGKAAQQTASWMTDDNALAYAGEDYEKILIRVMLAVSNLMHDGRDVMAYAHQIAEFQGRLAQRYESDAVELTETNQNATTEDAAAEPPAVRPADQEATQVANEQSKPVVVPTVQQLTAQLAISPYLRAILREQTHREYGEAERLFTIAADAAPGMQQVQRDLLRVRNGRHSQPGNGVLYVVTFVGRGPVKVERAHQPSSDALLIADRILSAIGDHTLPPTVAPVKIPELVSDDATVDTIRIATLDGQVTTSETLLDVGAIARLTHEANRDRILARAVVRRVIKKGAVYKAKQEIDSNSQWIDLAMNIGGVLWEASESADVRCWGLLPDQIQIARIELPAGSQLVSLTPWHHEKGTGTECSAQVEIRDGTNTWLIANFPGQKLTGEIVVSE